MKKWICAAGVAAALSGLGWGCPVKALAAVVPQGISVSGEDVGGLWEEEAKQKAEEIAASMKAQSITLDVDGTAVDITAEGLGYDWANPNVVEDTVKEYHTGNIIQRYMKQKDVSRTPVDLAIRLEADERTVQSVLGQLCTPLERAAMDASITREDGRFVVTPSQTGIVVDLAVTTAMVREEIQKGLKEPVHITAAVAVSEPAKTTEMLSQIQDVLGTFSTDFSSSSRARATNLQVGSSKINGRVLMPGETLSGYECMQPFTTANGYATAAAYENGQVVDSVGGGVCQIATTLYNAALFAELEITQRQNHSMIVTYVPPSNDAAIAGTYKDIKVTNPYDTPIYVEGGTSGRTLTFTIYGKETRPANRTLKFQSETLSVHGAGDPITKVDPSLAPGARVRVQSAHQGLKSRLWKCVYIDGVETERTLLHTDTYNASKAVYRVGPPAPVPAPAPAAPAEGMPAEEAPTEPAPVPTEPAPSSEPAGPAASPAPAEGIDGGPGITG
ncbi:MAG: vanomycin resistance protein VanB [Hungatella sp.]|jgi:vancomycin resistance protein YoaR|nr:vanomycin resistance protein VanB [Hungatella sp.]